MEVMARGYYLNNFVNRVLLKKSAAKSKSLPSSITKSKFQKEKEKLYDCSAWNLQLRKSHSKWTFLPER